MNNKFFAKYPFVKDTISVIIFVVFVLVGTVLINTFVFRSFSVLGPSMESTLYTGDRLIIDRLSVTLAQLQGKTYSPERGDIIVFQNPDYKNGLNDEYIVKRVIAFEGERVVLQNGYYIVYNSEFPKGFNPDDDNNGEPGSPTTGNVDITVPNGELFVSGDHRVGKYSLDSRNGLGTIPLYDVIGPVAIRIYPFDKIRTF